MSYKFAIILSAPEQQLQQIAARFETKTCSSMKIKVSDLDGRRAWTVPFSRDPTRFQFPLGKAPNGRIKFLLLLELSVQLVENKCIPTKKTNCLQRVCIKLQNEKR